MLGNNQQIAKIRLVWVTICVTVWVTLSLMISIAATISDANAESSDWKWLKDTYWYVPKSGLPTMVFDGDTEQLRTVSDQTVYHISGYRNGYFWGKTVVKLGTAPASCLSLLGSVTPEGRLLLTFTPVDPNATSSITQGIGEMQLQPDVGWTMENQMSSGPARLQVNHWAYMHQTKPGKRSWNVLPSANVSVQELLAECPGNGPSLVQ